MAENSAIEWCDHTFNPWVGCTRVSPACDDCYAARSTPARTMGIAWGAGQPRRRTADATWATPLRWQRQAAAFQAQHGRRQRVFCASLADVFDNEVPAAWRRDLFELIATTPDLDWLLLTKRIGNARSMLNAVVADLSHGINTWDQMPWPGVWIGATVVNQAEADRDIPKLLAVPAAKRFLSIEPMLGPIDLGFMDPCDHSRRSHEEVGCWRALSWVICGGESGPHARPMHPDWARSLRDQCAAAGVPFLFKQWGEWLPPYGGGVPDKYMVSGMSHLPVSKCGTAMMTRVGKKAAGRLLDGRTHDEFPA